MKNSHPSYTIAEERFLEFTVNRQFDNVDLNDKIKFTLYPEVHIRKCGAMLLYNLVDPEWITVDCDEPLSHGTFCEFTRRKTFKPSPSTSNTEFRINDKGCVMRQQTCFLFLWLPVSIVKAATDRDNTYLKHFSDIKIFQFLFEATRIQFLPIFIENAKWIATYERFANVYNYKRHFVHNGSMEAYAVYKQRPVKHFIGGNLFKCNGNVYISIYYVCDDKIDCPGENLTDEIGCQCKGIQKISSKCKFILDDKRNKTCSGLYLWTKDSKCQINVGSTYTVSHQTKIPENDCLVQKADLKNHFTPFLRNRSRHRCFTEAYNNFDPSKNLFNCNNGKQISIHLLNDLVADCGSEAEDEFLIKSIAMGTKFACPIKGQLPCIDGHSICYDLSQICIYKLYLSKYLLPCRTGQHLDNCKTFECNGKYKCPEYYCIPWSYVCDGKWDCPHGNDENSSYCNNTIMCIHKFKCRNSQTCIHVLDICDNKTDCPNGDDEFMCSLKDIQCIKYCDCLGFTILCVRVIIFDPLFINNFHFDSIHVRNSSEVFVRSMCMHANIIFILKLNNNNLTDVCNILPPLRESFAVDLNFNLITVITDSCFHNAPYLSEITFSHNSLTTVHKNAFLNLNSLAILNLSHNKLKYLDFSLIIQLSNLILLNLQGNSLQDFSSIIIPDNKLQFLLTENFYICCLFPRTINCITNKPWYLSCNNFLLNNKVKIIIFTICIFIFLLNILCISLQSYLPKSDFYQILTAINLTDLIYGIYLMFLLIGDQHYTHEFVWKASQLCFFIFALLLHFNISSVLFNFLSALCRLMITKYPLKTRFKQPGFLLKFIACSFTLSLLFTLFISSTIQLFSFAVTTPICTPFFDPSNSILVIKILAWFIAIFQFLATGATSVLYISLFYEIQKATKKVQNLSLKKTSNVLIIIQISVLISANGLTWIPSGMVYIFAMTMEKYPMEIILWTIIAISPINAIVNPSVFISTALRKILKQKYSESHISKKLVNNRNATKCSYF